MENSQALPLLRIVKYDVYKTVQKKFSPAPADAPLLFRCLHPRPRPSSPSSYPALADPPPPAVVDLVHVDLAKVGEALLALLLEEAAGRPGPVPVGLGLSALMLLLLVVVVETGGGGGLLQQSNMGNCSAWKLIVIIVQSSYQVQAGLPAPEEGLLAVDVCHAAADGLHLEMK